MKPPTSNKKYNKKVDGKIKIYLQEKVSMCLI